ncbi:MAG: DivIVA domain-containing protein [Bacteroidota bacterium]|nr:DivIVA domain-containing protein [Bacteroidota bacterium]
MAAGQYQKFKMKYTASEIKNQIFKTKLHGYDITEVKKYLTELASEWELFQREQSTLKDKVIELETRLKDYTAMEKAIQQTFMQSQETSGKAIENAKKEAQLIIQEAEIKATKMLDKSRSDLITIKEHLTILKAKKESIVSRFKMLLNSELELIKALEVDEESQNQLQFENQQGSAKDKSEIEEIMRNLE